ncbi:hypothetical protein F2Q70_00024759 [Brassica cretica]|uniref:Uncharacterized protein n=1 Tax=Brassica cretica TaxID=69181 RepID=A0A8S9L3N3_BRACR|nr:hypothetical protein F2Q70_00024759 [Brassica cretica]
MQKHEIWPLLLELHCATESVATVAEFEHHRPPQAAVTAKGRRVVDHDVEEEAVHVDFTAEEIRTTTTWQSSLLDITSAHGRGPRNTAYRSTIFKNRKLCCKWRL